MTNSLVRFGDTDIASASTKLTQANTGVRKLANALIKASGLNHITASAKRGFGTALMHQISKLNTSKQWHEIGAKDKKMLEGGGIKEDHWNLLRQIDRTEAPGGEKLITNQDIFKASDDLFLDTYQVNREGYTVQELADIAFKHKENLANTYMSHIYTETNAAVLEVRG